MDVIATVNISNGDFGDWLEFFKSYETLRHKYVENEIITQISSSQAVVSFTIVDIVESYLAAILLQFLLKDLDPA